MFYEKCRWIPLLDDIEFDEGVVNDIAHSLEHCSCGDCIACAVDEYERNKE